MDKNDNRTNQRYRNGKEGTKFQPPPSLLSLGKAEGHLSDLQRGEQDLDDEILWDDNPNQKYASQFLRQNERGPNMPYGPEMIDFPESKVSSSFVTDEQSFDDYAGPSITKASLSTTTSVLQVDVLDDTTEGIEVAKEDVPKDESTISQSIAFGGAPAHHPFKPWPVHTYPQQGEDVPSVIFVGGVPQVIFKQDTAEDSVHGAASTTSYRNMYTRKTIVMLLSILIIVVIASAVVIVTLLLKNEHNSAVSREETAGAQFVTPTTAPIPKGAIDDSSFMPTNDIVGRSQPPSGSSSPSFDVKSLNSKAPSYFPTGVPITGLQVPTATPSSNPSLAPTLIRSELYNFINDLSEDKMILDNEESPQFKALSWLSRDPNLDEFTRYQKMQRYVMATLFLSTSGNDWERSDQWLSYTDECTWFSKVTSPCNNNGILRELDLDGNHLQGTIPVELSWLQGLERLFLRDNEFRGTIPSQMSRLSNLVFLQLTRNDLSGTLPTELAGMTNLVVMGLGRNNLTGTLPTEYSSFQPLMTWGLERNRLSGSIPTVFGLLTNLENLALDRNNFTGVVPEELSQLSSLSRLSVSRNSFTGTIPSEVCTKAEDPDELFVSADCREIECRCCAECCRDGVRCISM